MVQEVVAPDVVSVTWAVAGMEAVVVVAATSAVVVPAVVPAVVAPAMVVAVSMGILGPVGKLWRS